MSLPYHKPPPYERPNWPTLNEGQKRYAMEQYNLALVRRGAQFETPEGNPVEEETSSAANEGGGEQRNAIDDLDQLDRLLDAVNNSQGTNTAQQEADTPETQPSTSQQSTHTTGTTGESMSAVDGVAAGSSSGSPLKTVSSTVTGEPGAKRLKTTHSPSALPGTSGNTDGMTGGAGGIPEGSVAIRNIPRGINTPKYEWTFTKKWKFLTFGVADQILSEDVTSATDPTSRWALTTSLANIPWEYAFMYMSPAELTRIQEFHGVFAKSCHVKVYQYNPRVAFQTADTTSTQATLNQNKFTRLAIGLRSNNNLWGSDRDYEYDTTEPMKPVGFDTTTSMSGQLTRGRLANAYYGLPNNSTAANMSSTIPAYCTGQELNLTRYYTAYAPKTGDIGFPQYNRFCSEFNAMDMVGQCVTEQSYDFEYAPLKPRARHYQDPVTLKGDTVGTLPTDLETELNILTGEKIEVTRAKLLPSDGARRNQVTEDSLRQAAIQEGSSSTGVNTTNFNFNRMHYIFPLEQAGVYMENNTKFIDYADQPSIHVGVRPVPKLGTATNDLQASSWLDTQMYWTVECTLKVAAADPFTYPRGNVADIPGRSQNCVVNPSEVPFLYTLDLPYQYGRKRPVANTFQMTT